MNELINKWNNFYAFYTNKVTANKPTFWQILQKMLTTTERQSQPESDDKM